MSAGSDEDSETAIGRLAKYFSARPKYEPLDAVVSRIVRKVRKAVEKMRFYDLLISGGQGVGKSTLALLILYKYYKHDAEKVLSNVFFDVEDLIEVLLEERRDIVLLDDAGVSLNKWRAMSEESVEYNIFQQIIRTRCSSIIYTTVYDNLSKFLRDVVKAFIALHTVSDTKEGTIVYGSFYTKKMKTRVIIKKLCDFTMHLEKLHQDSAFHELYVEYNRRREEFVKRVTRTILEKRRKSKQTEEAEQLFEKLESARRKPEEEFITRINEIIQKMSKQ
ncbi:MAG: hypothetical protein QXT64_02325 [Desulfurococcaceae archaeon]